jgi:hypothetical protein
MGGDDAAADARVMIESRYTFSPGRIRREDRLIAKPGISIRGIETEFASFSSGARRMGDLTQFARGAVRTFETNGYGSCTASAPPSASYAAPTGAFETLVRCARSQPEPGAGTITLDWTLTYAPLAGRTGARP